MAPESDPARTPGTPAPAPAPARAEPGRRGWRRLVDRRAVFFLGAGFVCFLLVPVADAGHRWVAVVTGVVYLVLSLLSALDHWSRGSGL